MKKTLSNRIQSDAKSAALIRASAWLGLAWNLITHIPV
jgi:hypothetical protein